MITTPMLMACSQKPISNESRGIVKPLRRLAVWSSDPIQVSDHAATAPARKKWTDPVLSLPRARPTMATTTMVATPPNWNKIAPNSAPLSGATNSWSYSETDPPSVADPRRRRA